MFARQRHCRPESTSKAITRGFRPKIRVGLQVNSLLEQTDWLLTTAGTAADQGSLSLCGLSLGDRYCIPASPLKNAALESSESSTAVGSPGPTPCVSAHITTGLKQRCKVSAGGGFA